MPRSPSRLQRTCAPVWLGLLVGTLAFGFASCGSGGGGSSGGGGGGTCSSCTVSIANVRNNGVTHSGFVIGTASGTGLTGVQVSLDGGAYAAATGTTAWSLMLPTGTNTWRDNTQHTIAVQALPASASSTATTITVRKGVNQDVNGDGYPDLLVGAQNAAAYLYLGSASGVSSTPTTTFNIYAGGGAVALGDVDGDGYADAIVGSGTSGTGAAAPVAVYHSPGSGGFPAGSPSPIVPTTTINDPAGSGHNFSQSVAVGDIDGDGYADLVVGAPLTGASNQGAVYIYKSKGSSGLPTAPTTTLNGPTGNHFGGSVSLGDVNNDGYADLAVSLHEGSSNSGTAYVYQAKTTSGISSSATPDTIVTTSSLYLSSAVALGDMTGDGNADFVVGLFSAAAGTNAAVYLYVSQGGSTAIPTTTTINIVAPGSTGQFGQAVAIGDVDGDGKGDLLVGAPDGSGTGGASPAAFVYLAHADGSGLASADNPATSLAESSSGTFGTAVMLTDVNGDGLMDAVVGDPNDSSNLGAGFVFQSAAGSGIPATATYTLPGQSAGIRAGGFTAERGGVPSQAILAAAIVPRPMRLRRTPLKS